MRVNTAITYVLVFLSRCVI